MALSQGLSLSNSDSSFAWLKETLKSRNISFIVVRSTNFWKWSKPTTINAGQITHYATQSHYTEVAQGGIMSNLTDVHCGWFAPLSKICWSNHNEADISTFDCEYSKFKTKS